jgi:hypothetical protein
MVARFVKAAGAERHEKIGDAPRFWSKGLLMSIPEVGIRRKTGLRPQFTWP